MFSWCKYISFLFLWGIVAMLACGIQSCTQEVFPDEPDPDNGGDRIKRYFSMQLLTAENTGIDPGDHDFTYGDGSELEHSMDISGKSQNVVIFFKDDMSYYGYSTIDYEHMFSQGNSDGDNTEISYIGTIHSRNPEDLYNLPEYGLLVLNAYNIIDALDALPRQATIADVLLLTDDAAIGRRPGMSGAYQTMTSVAYLEPENGVWEHSILFKFDKTKIFEIRMEALVSPAAVALVERMSAKFSLTLPGATEGTKTDFIPNDGRAQVIVCHYTDGHANYNNRSWTCSVEAWGINKYETSSYYFRNIIGEGANTTSYPYTYGNDIFTTGHPFYNGWNSAFNQRAYWGKDPHYDPEDGTYPRQYRPAVDNVELEHFDTGGNSTLEYVTYNTLSKDMSGLGSKEGVNLYSSENTLSDHRIGGLWQHDLGASELIVGARIHIDKVDENAADYDLFRNRIGVFYPSKLDFATYFIQTFNTQLSSQSSMTYRYYDWENPGANPPAPVTESLQLKYDNYKLYYRDELLTPQRMAELAGCTMAATVENGDGQVIPWVEGMYIGRRDVDPNTHEEVGAIQRLDMTDNSLKSLIYDWIGAFDHFNQGRMVYSVPVLHKATVAKVTDPAYRPSVGDYGVARNAWYSFAVQSISTLGTPVDDLDQRIIIYQSSLENSIMVEMKVLDWHTFDTEVTLPDHL